MGALNKAFPRSKFPDDLFERVCVEWATLPGNVGFFKESSHRLLIDRVLSVVVESFEKDLILLVEQRFETSHTRPNGTTFILGGDVGYSIAFDEKHRLAAGRSSDLPKGDAPANVVGVEAKRVLDDLPKAQTPLVAEMCTLRKLRTDTGRSGVMCRVLATAEKWRFMMIDDDGRLQMSDIICVGIGSPHPARSRASPSLRRPLLHLRPGARKRARLRLHRSSMKVILRIIISITRRTT